MGCKGYKELFCFLLHSQYLFCAQSILVDWLNEPKWVSHRTQILDVELDANHAPHPKPGWDKSESAGRVNVDFLESAGLSGTQGRCQPEDRESSVGGGDHLLGNRGQEGVGNESEEFPSPATPALWGPRAAPGSGWLFPFGLKLKFLWDHPSVQWWARDTTQRWHSHSKRQDVFNYTKIEYLTLSKMTSLSFQLKCQNYTILGVKRTI